MQLKRGFTLVELMVTIAVIVILATIAAPSMNNLIAKQRLNSAIRELSNTLGKARSQAALLRIEVTVILNTDNSNTANTFIGIRWTIIGSFLLQVILPLIRTEQLKIHRVILIS